MSYFTNKCMLCLLQNKNIKNVLTEDDDGILVEEKLKYVLHEEKITSYYNIIINFEPYKPKHICIHCLENLNHVYKFRQSCLKNLKSLSNYIEDTIAKRVQDCEIDPNTKIKDVMLDTTNQQDKINIIGDEVVVKGEPEEFHYEIDINDSFLSKEIDAEDTLQNEAHNTAPEINPRPHLCELCPKSFKRVDHLMRHKLVHSGEKPFVCDICNKAFIDKYHLITHKYTHTGLRPFQCNLCEKAFSQSGHLAQHKRTHTGEKPFQCKKCQKTFSNKKTLNIHQRTHTKEKPYACDLCDKVFGYKTGLIYHKRTHSGLKPFECDVCRKCFTEKGTLTAHKRIHSGEKPYPCEKCGKMFATTSNLLRHSRNHNKSPASPAVSS